MWSYTLLTWSGTSWIKEGVLPPKYFYIVNIIRFNEIIWNELVKCHDVKNDKNSFNKQALIYSIILSINSLEYYMFFFDLCMYVYIYFRLSNSMFVINLVSLTECSWTQMESNRVFNYFIKLISKFTLLQGPSIFVAIQIEYLDISSYLLYFIKYVQSICCV